MDEVLKEITEKIDALESKGAELLEKLDGETSPEEENEVKSQIEGLQAEIDLLKAEKEERKREADKARMAAELKDQKALIETLRHPTEFTFGGEGEAARLANESEDSVYGTKSVNSFYRDLIEVRTNGSDAQAARDRLNQSEQEWEGKDVKAMVESSGTGGGFLVPPQISADLIELRFQRALLRPLFSSVNVTTNKVIFNAVDSGLLAGWVAELAEKPLADMGFGQIEVGIFEAAGLAVISNQLLRDAPNVDSLVNADIAARLAIVEEVAFLKGSGVGQPLGILNTPGVDVIDAVGVTNAQDQMDLVQDAITAVYTDFFAPPNAILMHPRRWAKFVKARESTSPSTYVLGPPGGIGRRPQEPVPGYGAAQTPRGELFGYPVYTSGNVPSDLGGASDEDVIIVGDFAQGLIFDREGITSDRSEHVFFTSNQTVFRNEEALGFTAARYPKAFKVVAGDGLVA